MLILEITKKTGFILVLSNHCLQQLRKHCKGDRQNLLTLQKPTKKYKVGKKGAVIKDKESTQEE